MITFAEAREIVERQGRFRNPKRRVETLPPLESLGRYSVKPLVALDSNPRFDNSAMDGFAVIASETLFATPGAPVTLEVVRSIAAGDPVFFRSAQKHTCAEIMTGAKVSGTPFDAVIALEDVEVHRDSSKKIRSIDVRAPAEKGRNIRYAGTDIQPGQRLLKEGTQIAPQHLLALSMSGHTALDVYPRPRVVVISTGNEIVPYDRPEISGEEVRNSTAPFIIALLESYGAEVIFQGIVRDSSPQLRSAFMEAFEAKPDIVLTTGGVSAGSFDLIPDVLRDLGARVHFHKTAIRPGKPILFADTCPSGPVCICLPGNPIAVAAGCRFFVRTYLRALGGADSESPYLLPLTYELTKPAGLSFFQRGVRDGGGVRALAGQGSYMVRSLLDAEGWIVANQEGTAVERGEIVEWYPLW